jgi:hypothetical protein
LRPLDELLADLDQTECKLTSKRKRFLLSDEKSSLLRRRGLDYVYNTSGLFCGTAYKATIGGTMLTCTACAPVVHGFFATVEDWTREPFEVLCRAVVEARLDSFLVDPGGSHSIPADTATLSAAEGG